MTTSTKSSGGWTTQRTQRLGSNDNSLGAVAGSSPTDVWAVGNFLPSAKHSNQDATLSFAEHYNGTKWSVVRTPNAGPNFNSFYGLTAAGGGAWAGKWAVAHLPAVPGGADWSNLYGLSSSGASVWAVGTYVDPKTDNNNVLFLHEANGTWTINNAPNPGSGSNIPGGITAIDGQLWMAGTYDNGGSRLPLVEHH